MELGQPLSTDLVKEMENLSNTLIEVRKSMKAPPNYITKNDLTAFQSVQEVYSGQTSLDFDTKENGKMLLTGESNGKLTLTDTESK